MEKLLTTNKLTKQYGDFKAVEAVDLNVYHGDIYGLIGRNGAGKSTLLKMLSGLASPSSGEFNFFGLKMSNERNSNTKILSGRIGTLIENPGYFPNMSATENLKTKCIALGIKRKNYIADLLELIGLENTGNKKVKNFSLGMKQRLGLGLALIGEPDLVILDEPINGLDPQGIAEIRNTIKQLNKDQNITFIVSSHILGELSRIATRYGIIHQGHLVEELTHENLVKKGGMRIELKVDDPQLASVVLEKLDLNNYKVIDQQTIEVYEGFDRSGEIAATLYQNNIQVLLINVRNESLEDYYLKRTSGSV